MKCTSRTRSRSEQSSEGACLSATTSASTPTWTLTRTWRAASSLRCLVASSRNLPAEDGPAPQPALWSRPAASEWLSKWTHLVRCQLGTAKCSHPIALASHVSWPEAKHRFSGRSQPSPFSPVLWLALSITFVVLSLPNLSESLRVPYRYPHYPLFHKEFLQGSSGESFFSLALCYSIRALHK